MIIDPTHLRTIAHPIDRIILQLARLASTNEPGPIRYHIDSVILWITRPSARRALTREQNICNARKRARLEHIRSRPGIF